MKEWSMTIISGGQTGADRAATDFAVENGIPYGGWIPRGRLDENGTIPLSYSEYKETESSRFSERTKLNVEDSDATLIVSHGSLTGGSLLTAGIAERESKPCLHIDLDRSPVEEAARAVRSWIDRIKVRKLNVAGPRASNDSNIYQKTRDILESVFHIGTIEAAVPGLNQPLGLQTHRSV